MVIACKFGESSCAPFLPPPHNARAIPKQVHASGKSFNNALCGPFDASQMSLVLLGKKPKSQTSHVTQAFIVFAIVLMKDS